MEKISKTILYFCFVILITACSKDDDKANEDTPVTDVYVTGTDDNKAVYWKNGEKTILSNTNSSASSIFVTYNDDVYVAGSEGDKAVYWKNGAKTILEENDAVVNDIWVSQNDIVHAVGMRNDLTLMGNEFEAIYWKNDNEILLDFGEYAKGLFIKNESVYIVGKAKNGETVYWKDGVKVILPEDNIIVVDCSSIYVTDNDSVYTACNIITQSSQPQTVGAYWFNNNLIELQNSINGTSIQDITVVDGVPYFSGYEEDGESTAVYWEGDTKVVLSNTSSRAAGIFAMDNDIYISGYDENEQGIIQACYWKNMEQIFLPTDGLYTYPVDIFVKTSN